MWWNDQWPKNGHIDYYFVFIFYMNVIAKHYIKSYDKMVIDLDSPLQIKAKDVKKLPCTARQRLCNQRNYSLQKF